MSWKNYCKFILSGGIAFNEKFSLDISEKWEFSFDFNYNSMEYFCTGQKISLGAHAKAKWGSTVFPKNLLFARYVWVSTIALS